ncbi:MAG: type VI secretion system tube protein Hcp [Gammaproteobacteria bacterium]|nr:type VI secretion system tube protein Hcp [Gammaproteobacteria bacterium]
MFLCIDGVQGGSTDAQFAGCSNLVGYSQTVENSTDPNAGGGGAGGRPIGCGEAVVVKQIDNASPILFTRVLTGVHAPSAIVHFRTQGENPVEFLTISCKTC